MWTFSTVPNATLSLASLRRAGLGSFFRPVDVERIGVTEPGDASGLLEPAAGAYQGAAALVRTTPHFY
jgi:hypothetical protein